MLADIQESTPLPADPDCPICKGKGEWEPESLSFSMPLRCNCTRMAAGELAELRQMVGAMVGGLREMAVSV